MEKSDTVKRFDDHNLDHYYKHLKNNGLVPRKQGFGVPPTVKGNNNVLGEEARRDGLPHIVSGISLSDIFNQQSRNRSRNNVRQTITPRLFT